MQTLPMVHMSPETAYVISDYPFGFNLRCQKRLWIEYKPKFGFRVMSQTTNPRKPGIVWNKPHPGVYHSVCVLYLDDTQHVQVAGLTMYSSWHDITAFMARHGSAFAEGSIAHKTLWAILRQAEAYAARRAAREATETVLYNIHSTPPVRIV